MANREGILEDHERAHNGKVGSVVRHGQDATGKPGKVVRHDDARDDKPGGDNYERTRREWGEVPEVRYHKLRNQLDFD